MWAHRVPHTVMGLSDPGDLRGLSRKESWSVHAYPSEPDRAFPHGSSSEQPRVAVQRAPTASLTASSQRSGSCSRHHAWALRASAPANRRPAQHAQTKNTQPDRNHLQPTRPIRRPCYTRRPSRSLDRERVPDGTATRRTPPRRGDDRPRDRRTPYHVLLHSVSAPSRVCRRDRERRKCT